MSNNPVKVKSIDNVTHDVLKIVTEKPAGYSFSPGQATEVSINKNGWDNKPRPFTFTCLPEDQYLEFTIKTYPSHRGVTNELLNLKRNDELILHEVFGSIGYRGEGVFIAGGAGVTPFISIFRFLKLKHEVGNNTLLFANKTKADIILEEEFQNLLGNHFIKVLSEENVKGYGHGHITLDLLRENISDNGKKIYLCGPEPMMQAIENYLKKLSIDTNMVIKEKF
ncbi:MAG: flavodoxin reductase [Flavisolibacter sp.]